MSDTIKERLIAYLKYKGVNNSEFGRIIGVSNAYISSIRKSIQPDKVDKISANFPDLNIDWLITGKGEMLRTSITQIGDNNNHQQGNGNTYNSLSALEKALDEISEMRKLLAEAIRNNKEQADNFFAILRDLKR